MSKVPDRLYKFVTLDDAPADAATENLYPVTLSDDSVDRHGDRIDQAGWMLDTYKANPVLLWAHDASQLPVGKTLDVGTDGNKLRGKMEFAKHKFAQDVKDLVDGKFLRAVSVGFAPKAYDVAEDREGSGFFPALDFKQQELLELSVVPVPANPNALIDAKSQGLNTDLILEWAERTLEQTKGTGLWISRQALEQVCRAGAAPKVISVPAPAPTPVSAPELTTEQAAAMVRAAVQERFALLRMKRTGKLD